MGLLRGVFPDELLQIPLSVLDQRVKRKGRKAEKRAQLSLAGLLALAAPVERKRLARQLEPIKGAMPWRAEEVLASEIGFVTAVCALEGMALLRPRSAVFTADTRAATSAKYEMLEAKGPAVEYLRQRVFGGLKRG